MTGEPDLDLESLTGVRSGKHTYYRALRRSDERLTRAVQAMDTISRAAVRTVEGPRGLLEEVARTAAGHLRARWTVLALADRQMAGARPRFIVVRGAAEVLPADATLPDEVQQRLAAARSGECPAREQSSWVGVPMTLAGEPIGVLAAEHGLDDLEAADLSVLRVLANQAAVSLHTSEQFNEGLALHQRARQLNDETAAQAKDLAQRTAELRAAEQQLLVAGQRQLVDDERHRIARELHDTVTQQVLSAGMAVELARRDAEQLRNSPSGMVEQLQLARDLSARAVDQLRRAIYALHQPQGDRVRTLPELLAEVTKQHTDPVHATLRVEGDVQPLPEGAHHELTRAVSEALFNASIHAEATRAIVRLRYRPNLLLLTIADDGTGEPSSLRRHLRVSAGSAGDGSHRGLANIQQRVSGLGGTLQFRRARLGGVRVELRVPLPLPQSQDSDLTELVGQLTRPLVRPLPVVEDPSAAPSDPGDAR